MDSSILQALAGYLRACPVLEGCRLNIGYLPESARGEEMEFSLDAAGDAAAGRQYLGDGAPGTRQFLFTVRGVFGYGPQARVNLDAAGVWPRLALWLEAQSREDRLPDLPPGARAIRLEALDGGRLTENTATTGKYQMPCALTYLQYPANE